MSTWWSLEEFLHGRTATILRRCLFTIGFLGVGGDYYVMKHRQVFPANEGERYVVDWSPISMPRCRLYTIPNGHYVVYSPWTPVNGEVVVARELPQHPRWLQLQGGRFVEKDTCGVALLRRESDVLAERLREQQRQAGSVEGLRELERRSPTPPKYSTAELQAERGYKRGEEVKIVHQR